MGSWQSDGETPVRTLLSVQPQALEQFRADHDTVLVDDYYCLDHRYTSEEGILILSGGLTVHNLRDPASFVPETANPLVHEFNDAVSSAISISDVSVSPGVNQHVCSADAIVSKPVARKTALVALTQHGAFRLAHPREDHFVPIFVAAGAGEEGGVHVLSGLYGSQTVAFGV